MILLNEEMELPAGSGGCWFHSGAAPPPESVGWGVGFLPPPRSSPRAGCGEGQASADVTQLPSFSKEMRTVGWQSVCFHICSFRILRCYSTHCLTPAALGFSTALLPRLGRGQGRGGRGSHPRPPGRPRHPHGVGSFIPPSGLGTGTTSSRWDFFTGRPVAGGAGAISEDAVYSARVFIWRGFEVHPVTPQHCY